MGQPVVELYEAEKVLKVKCGRYMRFIIGVGYWSSCVMSHWDLNLGLKGDRPVCYPLLLSG